MRADMLSVFIGWDAREDDAWQVARSSLLKHATCAAHVQPLLERELRFAGLYRRHWEAKDGHKHDRLDGKPFSTEFSFTRFLVPALCQWQGWALFCDCDFLFRADAARLMEVADDRYAVMVCKQNYRPKSDLKMDSQIQQPYFRKNWSSFMLFNCAHPVNKMLTVESVNREHGSWLHGFGWVPDSLIGSLPPNWNWIEGTSEGEPLAVHFTSGGPWFRNYRHVAYAEEWLAEARRIGLSVMVDEKAA